MIDLPKPIAAYFAADLSNADEVARCFTEDATVKDEGNTYIGRDEIARWKSDTSRKYDYTSTPIALEVADGKVVVISHLVGNFPGSPVDLRYFFKLDGERIATLETAL